MKNEKIIMLLTGNFLKYRLDIIDYTYPKVAKEKIIFFTDNCSYKNVIEKYRQEYTFVIIEDERKDYPISQQYEHFLCAENEQDYNEKWKTFYSRENNRYYPYHITRLIFPYLIKNNIKNFIIADSDYAFLDNCDQIDKAFDYLKEGEFHFPLFGPSDAYHYNKLFKDNFSSQYKNIKFEVKELQNWDGYCKGFHFRSLEDMELFFKLWNDTVELILTNRDIYRGFYDIDQNRMFFTNEWIIAYIVKLFEFNFNYQIKSTHSALWSESHKINLGIHVSKPEEKIYYDVSNINGYENFVYDNVRTVSDFVKQNKKSLYDFYINRIPYNVDAIITDSHVYLKILFENVKR